MQVESMDFEMHRSAYFREWVKSAILKWGASCLVALPGPAFQPASSSSHDCAERDIFLTLFDLSTRSGH